MFTALMNVRDNCAKKIFGLSSMVECLRTTNVLINPKISTKGNNRMVGRVLVYFSVFLLSD